MNGNEPTLEEAREIFNKDQFATKAAGCRILEARRGHAVCEMPIHDIHRNAMGGVMGGAIFTPCRLRLSHRQQHRGGAFGGGQQHHQLHERNQGKRVESDLRRRQIRRRLGFYTVDVEDDTGRLVAKMCATCAR